MTLDLESQREENMKKQGEDSHLQESELDWSNPGTGLGINSFTPETTWKT